ncbi:MAG: protein arginine kinase [Desulfitobacteriaceae bacterium]|nr:protein arginine kinase [Desulfitobacteriaceae bacterium]MDD4345807.1 protein arginine kinase [Desulfitobacteriaceae bacterium]MDD4400796.1 protein arginine kinase [Desulfitobacteriaceae bacterium]
MERKQILIKHSFWMKQQEDSPVVLSSRVRLARNLDMLPFPHALTQQEAKKIEKTIAEVLREIEVENENLAYLSLTELSTIEKQVLLEKHLISSSLIKAVGSQGVALAQDHRCAVMVNEEDHIRLQVLMPGDKLAETFRLANILDDALEDKLDFAYKEALGYLTACPTNVGTGMRASIMVHLPALAITNQVQQVLGALTHLGLAVRGIYGEGSQAHGHIFQVSNQITLGKSEEDIVVHLKAVSSQIMEHELQAREALRREANLSLEDKVWRARGTLQNAHLLTSDEAINLLSFDKMGTDMGILPKTKQKFAALLVDSHPGSLQYSLDRELSPSQRDEQRARLFREAMS